MTDMRATERLLEVLYEFIDRSGLWIHDADLESQQAALDAYKAIAELRRRGDTLVRAEDLHAVMEVIADSRAETYLWGHKCEDAIERLEKAC